SVKRVDGSVLCARASGLGVMLTGSHAEGENSQILSATADYETNSGSAGIYLGSRTRGSITVVGAYAETTYPNRLPLPGSSRGYQTTSAGIEFDRRLGARIEATLKAYYTHVDVNDQIPLPVSNGAVSDFDGFTYSGGVTFRASSRLQTAALFQRQVQPTL